MFLSLPRLARKAAALTARWQSRQRRVRLTRRLLLLAGGTAAVAACWLLGFLAFVAGVPHGFVDDGRRSDAIVVLTGGSTRMQVAFDLLAEGRAEKLFVSGVYRGVEVTELLRLFRQGPERMECCVVLGYAADDTVGNARETAEWMRREGYRSLRLVTANYHMPRSLSAFRRAAPAIEIMPHPVFPAAFKLDDWWRWPGSARLLFAEYNKLLGWYVFGPLLTGPGLP